MKGVFSFNNRFEIDKLQNEIVEKVNQIEKLKQEEVNNKEITIIDKREDKYKIDIINVKESDYKKSGINEYIHYRKAIDKELKNYEKIFKILFFIVLLLALVSPVVFIAGILKGLLYIFVLPIMFFLLALMIAVFLFLIFYSKFGNKMFKIGETVKDFLNYNYELGIKENEWLEVEVVYDDIKIFIKD